MTLQFVTTHLTAQLPDESHKQGSDSLATYHKGHSKSKICRWTSAKQALLENKLEELKSFAQKDKSWS